MGEASVKWEGLSEIDKARFDNVRKKAEQLGVLDINFSVVDSANSIDDLACYESILDIIEKHKEHFDKNAQETNMEVILVQS